MQELTPKEKAVYEYIRKIIDENGYPPTVRDICKALNIRSTSSVHIYLERLENKGFIKRETGKSRSVRIEQQSKENKYHIPVLGQVAAGTPILAQQNYEGYTVFSTTKSYEEQSLFALKIKGESMINAGILDGDFVIVQQSSSCDNGEIVVAMANDEATVKRFYKENGHFRLQPENDNMEPIIVDSVEVIGKVVGLVRYY